MMPVALVIGGAEKSRPVPARHGWRLGRCPTMPSIQTMRWAIARAGELYGGKIGRAQPLHAQCHPNLRVPAL